MWFRKIKTYLVRYPKRSLLKPYIVLLAAVLGISLAACTSQRTALPPLPTDTPAPATATSTPTIVWFPPTATYTPFPTLVMTPTQALNPSLGILLLADDFSDSEPWELSRSSTASAALGMNELTLALKPPSDYIFSLRNQPVIGDFYLEVTASPSICRGEDEYGVLLRVSPALEFYRFSLSCNGQVRIDKFYNSTASSPHPWTQSGAVPPGAPSQSRLGIWARGKEMRFFVNDIFQFDIRDPSLQAGAIGFFVRANEGEAVTVSFSDLAIYTLTEP